MASILTEEAANALLPKNKVIDKVDPLHLIYTVIAEPKFGKSTWFSAFPNSLMFAFERGHAFIEAYKIVITSWAGPEEPCEIDGVMHMSLTKAIEAVCASNQFEFVFWDTVDAAAKMCLDHFLRKHGLTHQQDWDFGKGSDVCLNTPFRQAINRLTATGRGVGFITHTEVKDSRFSSGNKSRKETSLPTGIHKFVIPASDVILHGKFGARNKKTKKRDRIFQAEGNDDTLAGSRVQGKFRIPSRFLVDPEDPWGQWKSFFENPEAADEAEAAAARTSAGAATEEEAPDQETKVPKK